MTFDNYMEKSGQVLTRDSVACLQMNLGYACNLSCSHCHVGAGPHRTEEMSQRVMEHCFRFVEQGAVNVVDLTGGAPEMNPHLRYLIKRLRMIGSLDKILLRSNLSILAEADYADLPSFLAENNVEIVASMPCYLKENVAAQRGPGVYEANIKVLQELNRIGYGTTGPGLHLVYNPGGDFLPGPQPALEAAYKEHLGERFGITFTSLYTITNMPIGRFRSHLERHGQLQPYLDLLAASFNPANLARVMCRNMVSVDWQGQVYDCDFNHILRLPLDVADGYIGNVRADDLIGTAIASGEHCFACTAGAGSSCQGSLSA